MNFATWLRMGMGNCPMYFSAAFWLARSLQQHTCVFRDITRPSQNRLQKKGSGNVTALLLLSLQPADQWWDFGIAIHDKEGSTQSAQLACGITTIEGAQTSISQ